jgi:Rod binding domain-containing protein
VAPRLVRAAHEFEAQLMKELLEPMTRNDALFGEDEAGEKGTLVGFASESLAGALSAGGGLGIADRVIHELRPSNNSADPRVIGKVQENTLINAH